MSYTGLKTLKNFPVLPALEILDISDNCLTGADFSAIYLSFKKIKSLLLSNNAIREISHITVLSKCLQLTSLDLSANPLTDIQAYRENIFEKLCHLEALDGFDKDGSEWSVFDANEIRDDSDYVHDNEFMGEQGNFYSKITMEMRQGQDDDSAQSKSCQSS